VAARLVLIVLALVAVSAAAALARWGTHWTIPRAPSVRAHYTLLAAWDGHAIPGGKLDRPIGVAVARSGDVYVTDARLRVVRFNSAGEFLGQWGRKGDGRGEFRNPVGVVVGRNGTVHVSDFEQDRIQTFAPAGEFLHEVGRPGSGRGQFNSPAGLAVDEAGSLYVADFYNHRVQKFDEDGMFQGVFGHANRLGAGALHYPTGVAITPQRELLVADAYNYQLQWFDPGGSPLRQLGYHLFWLWPRPVTSTMGFFVPTDATVGSDGVTHVADSGNHRVVMLTADGAYVADWRIPDADANVYSSEHVAISPEGSVVYATDLGRNRVLVLGISRP
jgi:DNA-binding beta-propeller fold protein YncE